MMNLKQVRSLLNKQANPQSNTLKFYKTGKGDYAEHDKFIGVTNPMLRQIAKDYPLTLEEIQALIESPINEERLLSLFILINRYQKSSSFVKEQLHQFYLRNLEYVNNWNLVDASAHLIVGAHLLEGDKTLLLALAQSKVMWERRVAIVSTWHFIRNNKLEWTFQLAKILLKDEHDLMHKAVG